MLKEGISCGMLGPPASGPVPKVEAALGAPVAGGAVPLGLVPNTFGEAVEVDGEVPVSNGEPNGLVEGAVVPASNSEEFMSAGLPLPKSVVPAPKEEEAPEPLPVLPEVVVVPEEVDDDPAVAPPPKDDAAPESSCENAVTPLHNPPATIRAIQCRRKLME